MNRWILVTLTCVLILGLPCVPFAQEEEAEYSDGIVIKVNGLKSEIVIMEYDFDSGEMAEVTYSVSPDAELENVNALKEITNGTEVNIQYIIGGDGKKIAKYITVYMPESEEYEFEPVDEATDKSEEEYE